MKQVDDKYDCHFTIFVKCTILKNFHYITQKNRHELVDAYNEMNWEKNSTRDEKTWKELIDICKVMKPQNYENK